MDFHAWSRWLESFADRHQHVIAAFAVFWTALAVMVALWTASFTRRNNQPRLKATVSLASAPPPDARPDAAPAYIIVQITNIGYLPVTLRVECLWWRIAFSKRRIMQLPRDFVGDDFITKRSYPIELPPNETDTIFLCRAGEFGELLSVSGFLPRPRWLARIAAVRVRPFIVTNRGDRFRAKMGNSLRDHIRQIASFANTEFLCGKTGASRSQNST
jgi:hypothetical protein